MQQTYFITDYIFWQLIIFCYSMKVSVRKKALQMLLDVYHDYCIKCSEGIIKLSVEFEQIPCGILLLCYDKDTEFGYVYWYILIAINFIIYR